MKKLNLQKTRLKFKDQGIKLFGAKELMWFFGATQRAAQLFLHRNTTKGFLKQVRKDLYFFADNQPNPFFIANQAYQPSYISLETALSHFHLIPETVYTITSVTSKPTQEFRGAHLHLHYSRIKTHAYTGYTSQQLHGETVLIAQPAKALADYLYFVSQGRKKLNDRLNWSRVALEKLIDFSQLFQYQALDNLIEVIKKEKF